VDQETSLDVLPVPAVVNKILSEFASLFEEPKGLPPKRMCDHKIPLLPGSTPMKLRPYRYNPMQKNEIEKQVAELLKQGVLQYSFSPFASPALPVMKKDLTWRLCQDFHHLNAMTVDKWRSYLQHSEFLIKTDQQSLVNLMDQRLTTPWQHKALTKLLGLQFKIVYNKGLDNRVADALSRNPALTNDHLMTISHSTPVWLEEVVKGYQLDTQAQKLLAKLAISSPFEQFSLRDGLICFRNRVWIGNNALLQSKITQALHDGAVGGHSGFYVTYHRIKKLFSWPGMKKFIKTWVAQCAVCQQAKTERVAYPGLLQPLQIPAGAWEVVTMDFVDGLPRSAGFNCIMVVVDKFSRYAHFVPLSHPYTAFSVATAYMKDIFRLHGLPKAIV
jgi:hypothetical protein